MVCYYPLLAIRKPDSSIKIVGSKRRASDRRWRAITGSDSDQFLELPCGQCIGCRLEYSRQWAIRCVHEASLYENNCFITLTYDQDHLPHDRSLNKSHFQKFMKRLRKRFGGGIRFYHCGEYGEMTRRPHYHACLFNFDFSDKKLFKIVNKHRLYTSEQLQELWPFGFSTIGDVTFESAAYVARYIMKKHTGKDSAKHYEVVDPETGEVFNLLPEYTTMSRRPGIAHDWFSRYKSDVFPKDFISVNGKKCKPPKYYDKLFEHDLAGCVEMEFNIKPSRLDNLYKHIDNNSVSRLNVREKVKLSQIKRLPRVVE